MSLNTSVPNKIALGFPPSQFTELPPSDSIIELTKPCLLSNIIENTIPIAIVFVTYGKKKIVWKNFCNDLIEFNATAINIDNVIEIGTETKVITIVLIKNLKNEFPGWNNFA